MNINDYVSESERLYKILNQRRPDPTIQKQYEVFHKKYETYINSTRELFTKNDGEYIVDIHNGDVTKVKQNENGVQLNIDAALFYKNKQVEHKNVVLEIQTHDDLSSLKHAEIHEFVFDKENKKAVFLFLDKEEQLQNLVVNFNTLVCEVSTPKAAKKLKV